MLNSEQVAAVIASRVGLSMPEEGVWKLVDEALAAWRGDYTRADAMKHPEWAADFVTYYLDSFIEFNEDGTSTGHAK